MRLLTLVLVLRRGFLIEGNVEETLQGRARAWAHLLTRLKLVVPDDGVHAKAPFDCDLFDETVQVVDLIASRYDRGGTFVHVEATVSQAAIAGLEGDEVVLQVSVRDAPDDEDIALGFDFLAGGERLPHVFDPSAISLSKVSQNPFCLQKMYTSGSGMSRESLRRSCRVLRT